MYPTNEKHVKASSEKVCDFETFVFTALQSQTRTFRCGGRWRDFGCLIFCIQLFIQLVNNIYLQNCQKI